MSAEQKNMTVTDDVYQLIETLTKEIKTKPLQKIVACSERRTPKDDAPVVVIIQTHTGSKAFIFATDKQAEKAAGAEYAERTLAARAKKAAKK